MATEYISLDEIGLGYSDFILVIKSSDFSDYEYIEMFDRYSGSN
jgi:hypothetical protein